MTELYAALDLGSNSFHMLLARRRAGQLHPLERAKEKVQLLAGFRDGRLSDAAMERGLSCLERFAQRLITVPRSQLRMVGTHALREAANRDEFVTAAERIMGTRLGIVSGLAAGACWLAGIVLFPAVAATRQLASPVTVSR